ncbi:MAG: 3-dehydroquinate synthase [Planctomycetota bacterium]
MASIQVDCVPSYAVHVGSNLLASIEKPSGATVLLTDETVHELHGERLSALRSNTVITVEPGEASKSFSVLEGVLEQLADAGLDRNSTLITLGGGSVGDLGGLAASLYMRGIDVIHCPTTLLAMVDASVGGKTAVNLSRGKNLAGTFLQPRAVYADIDTLSTLPLAELQSGLGEVVKSALIGDAELLELLEERCEALLAGDPEITAEIVTRCVRVKSRIVAADERESGRRKVLNFGHTFGHAIEQVAGFGTIPHGMAVAVGLVLALEASHRIEMLVDGDLPGRIRTLLGNLGLPSDLSELREHTGLPLAAPALQRAMKLDKKGAGGKPLFVLIESVGSVTPDGPLDDSLIEELLTPQ